MKSLYDYDLLINEVFYKCHHILEYIENNSLSNLDEEAIKATIMDALVSKHLIDPKKESLDFKNLMIVNNLDYYVYEKHPNIAGIPLWMKEEFRKKSLTITGGIPISLFLSKPPSKIVRYCIYDPNTAVSSIFNDATFYNALYTSPTRGIEIDEVRPFVEVEIDGELYLVDTLTKRILKSSWFKSNYNFKIINEQSISKMKRKTKKIYNDSIKEHISLSTLIPFLEMSLQFKHPSQAEMIYELEQSKKYFKDEWNKYNEIKKGLHM